MVLEIYDGNNSGDNTIVGDLKIEVIDSQESLSNIRDEWNDLLKKSKANNIFLTWEWVSAWTDCFLYPQRKLFVITVYRDGELLGVAPWYIDQSRIMGLRTRRIGFLGDPEGDADYLDVITKREKEREVTQCIFDFLFEDARAKWDLLTLTDVPGDSLFLLYFIEQIENEGKFVEVKPGSFCPIVDLPKEWVSYFSTLSSNRREQFNRHVKILNRHGRVDYVTATSKEEIEINLEDFYSLYNKAWGEKATIIKKLIDTYRSKIDSDNLRVELLKIDGRAAAGMVNLKYEKYLFMYLMATDKELIPKISIGNILVGISIKKAIEESFEYYDFLKGTEQYKFHWANIGKRSLNITSYRGGTASINIYVRNHIKNIGKIILR